MQISNKKILIFCSGIIFSALIGSHVFAQSMEMIPMPAMPSMPSMPTTQSISPNSFYTPTIPNAPSTPKKPDANNDSSNAVQPNASVTNANSTNDQMNTLLNKEKSAILTAADISGLYDSGLFSDLSSLNSSSLQNYTTSTQTNLLLQQMLNSLNDLKTQQNNANEAQKTQMEAKQSDAQNFKSREPQILRFKINGYDIISSLETYFISEQEADGTFLITADRKYYANQYQRNETFYMLFRATSTTGSSLAYNVQTTLSQDVKNENSFIYRMAQVGNLTAEKTGNLVVLHYTENGLSIDLLLDLDNK